MWDQVWWNFTEKIVQNKILINFQALLFTLAKDNYVETKAGWQSNQFNGTIPSMTT